MFYSFLQVFFDLCYLAFLAFSVPRKCRDCKFVGISSPYLSLCLTCFPVAKMSKVQWNKDRNMDTIMEISVVHGEPFLLYIEN